MSMNSKYTATHMSVSLMDIYRESFQNVPKSKWLWNYNWWQRLPWLSIHLGNHNFIFWTFSQKSITTEWVLLTAFLLNTVQSRVYQDVLAHSYFCLARESFNLWKAHIFKTWLMKVVSLKERECHCFLSKKTNCITQMSLAAFYQHAHLWKMLIIA